MNDLTQKIKAVDINAARPKYRIFSDVIRVALDAGLTIDDVDLNKPWGFYIRFEPSDADLFVPSFFPGLSLKEARLGIPDAALSPKFLLVSPDELLSWQYHDRRAERWAFLTDGAYYKSTSDNQGDIFHAKTGDVVQFEAGERHRLVGLEKSYVLVAEIWQHTDKDHASDEADIIRLADKYQR